VTVSIIYPDLSEIGGIGHPSAGNMRSILERDVPQIKTPAAIIYLANMENAIKTVLAENEWSHLRRTLNWHNLHGGDHPIDLWYKAFPFKTLVGPIEEWSCKYPKHWSSTFGCGAGYEEGFPRLNDHCKASNAYLMLFRVKKDMLTNRKLNRFKDIRYTCVFQTDTAYYFANGFPPTKWKGKDWEHSYWKRTKHYDCQKHFEINEF
jgi:hypothetical protein